MIPQVVKERTVLNAPFGIYLEFLIETAYTLAVSFAGFGNVERRTISHIFAIVLEHIEVDVETVLGVSCI